MWCCCIVGKRLVRCWWNLFFSSGMFLVWWWVWLSGYLIVFFSVVLFLKVMCSVLVMLCLFGFRQLVVKCGFFMQVMCVCSGLMCGLVVMLFLQFLVISWLKISVMVIMYCMQWLWLVGLCSGLGLLMICRQVCWVCRVICLMFLLCLLVVCICVCICMVVFIVVWLWNLVGQLILNSMFFIIQLLQGCWKWNGCLLKDMLQNFYVGVVRVLG